MPRPFGIMSLWDSKYFGHSLIEAAQLIGQDPEVLKQDPLQNIRGGAALLRKIYDQTPKPEGTTEADIESWRYAIRKYCGIPEPDLNAQHALKVYAFMSKGYHQYGIEWDARPVNLEPIREETRRIVAEEKAKRAALHTGETNLQAASSPERVTDLQPQTKVEKPDEKLKTQAAVAPRPEPLYVKVTTYDVRWWVLLVAAAALIGGTLVYLKRHHS